MVENQSATGAQGYPVATHDTATNIFHLKINLTLIEEKYPNSDPLWIHRGLEIKK